MNYPSCVLSSNFLGYDVMGYISHPNVLSSWMLEFYYTMKIEVIYCLIHCGFWTLHNNIFCMLITVKKTCSTVLYIILLCISLFTLRQDGPPPVFFIDILNYSTSMLVTYIELFKATSSPTIIRLHGCC